MERWSLRESLTVGLGSIYNLNEREILTIGRDSSCDIVLKDQSVDAKHANIKWDNVRRQFSIHDLNTSNGTYINQFPLRGTSKLLEQRDNIKFGYCTGQVFRVDLTLNNPPAPSSGMKEGGAKDTTKVVPQIIKTSSSDNLTTPCTGPSNSTPLPHPLHAPVSPPVVDPIKRSSIGSPLYGVPTWWGDDNDIHSDSEVHKKRTTGEVFEESEDDQQSKDESKGESASFTIEFESAKKSKPTQRSLSLTNKSRPLSFSGDIDLRRQMLTPPTSKDRKVRALSLSPSRAPPPSNSPSNKKGLKGEENKEVTSSRRIMRSSTLTVRPRTNPSNTPSNTPSNGPSNSSSIKTKIERGSTEKIEGRRGRKEEGGGIRGRSASMRITSRPLSTRTDNKKGVVDEKSKVTRKQWNENKEIPHRLLLSSIEERLRMLSSLTATTSSNIKKLTGVLQESAAVNFNEIKITPLKTIQLPQWKVYSSEYDKICQYIMNTEESLKEINESMCEVVSVDDDIETDDSSSTPSLVITSTSTEADGKMEGRRDRRRGYSTELSASSEADV